jgi:adenylate cyclase
VGVARRRGGRLDVWLWRHHQGRLRIALVLFILVANSLAVAVPAVAVGSIFLDLTVVEGLAWFVDVEVCGGLAILAGVLVVRRQFEPLKQWSEGDRSRPAVLQEALLALPRLLLRMVLTVLLGFQFVLGYPFVLWMARPGPQGAIALALAYVLVTSTIGILTSGTAQLLIRTAVIELGRASGSVGSIPSRWWTLRWRLVTTIGALCGLAGVVTSALVLGNSATENDYLVALIAGTVWGAYVAWLVDVMFIGPMLAPLDELIDGTARVRRGELAEAVPVLAADELGDLAVSFNEMQEGLQQRAALQEAFGSYVDPALAQRLLDSGSSVFAGEERVVTVLFADVRGFTTYAETVDAATAVTLLNRLFDAVVPVLHAHGGHANHYLGDGLLAVFGAPLALEAHADAAVASAAEIHRRVRSEFGEDLRLGIGINTGPVIAGTVGGGGRHEFTVIGDTVNIAARVEQLTKETGDLILITEATRLALSTPRPRSTKRGDFDVRGRAARLALHSMNPFPRTAQRSTR